MLPISRWTRRPSHHRVKPLSWGNSAPGGITQGTWLGRKGNHHVGRCSRHTAVIKSSWLNRGGADPREKEGIPVSEMTKCFFGVCFGKEKRFKKNLWMENLGKLKQRLLLDSEWCVLLQEMVPFVRGPGSQALPSSSFWFYSHTLASDSRCPCVLLSLWCPDGLVVHSVAHRDELREWALPGSFLSPSRRPTQWSLDGCLWNAWGGYIKLCAVDTRAHTHAVPPPSPSLSSLLQLQALSFASWVFSFLLVLLGDAVYMPGRHCAVLYVTCLTDSLVELKFF